MTLPGAADAEIDDQLDSEYDPFEVIAAADSIMGNVRDPYPRFARARRDTPIEPADPVFAGGRTDIPEMITLHRFDDVNRVLRDATTFSSARYDQVMGKVLGHSILEMDAPEHQRHRSLIAQAFRPKALIRWQEELIVPLVHELVDEFAPRGRAELVREFTVRFPIMVIAGILGLPRAHYNRFLRWSMELISVTVDWDRGLAASASLREYFSGILDERRREPRSDLISELVMAEIDGHTLSDDEILPFLNLLLPAGAETTYRSLGNLLFGLLSNPDQLEAVRADRELVPCAIEEAFRWEPPLLFIFRTATSDTEVGGVPLAEGGQVVVNIGSANRDEARWPDGEVFDIHREPQPHVAFAAGPHACLGMHLARLEMRDAIEVLLDRLPGLRFDPEAEAPHIHGLIFRSPTALPVLFG